VNKYTPSQKQALARITRERDEARRERDRLIRIRDDMKKRGLIP